MIVVVIGFGEFAEGVHVVETDPVQCKQTPDLSDEAIFNRVDVEPEPVHAAHLIVEIVGLRF